jgi:hypothetical protein
MSTLDLRHFNQVQLSRRWTLSPRTLERWRWLKAGPPYLKIGGRVVYRLEDVEATKPTSFISWRPQRAGVANEAGPIASELRPHRKCSAQIFAADSASVVARRQT